MRLFILLALLSLQTYAFWFTDNTPKKVIEVKAPPLDIDYEKTMALEYLNTLRQKAGMVSYVPSPVLEKAADAHARYLIRNNTMGHFEQPRHTGFTGKTPSERAFAAGYNVATVTENVSVNVSDYKASIDNLFSAIYHRFGFLDFQSDEIGIGISQNPKDTNQDAYVYDTGIYELNRLCSTKSYSGTGKYVYKVCKNPNHRIDEAVFHEARNIRKSASKKIVIYPYDHQKDVPPAFYAESPDPLPDYDVSGFPVSIQFNDYYIRHARIKTFQLFDDKERKIPGRIVTSANDLNDLFTENQFAFFPLKRLDYNQRYKVVVEYRADGKNGTKVWHFQTRKLQKPFFIIQKKKAHITIKPHTAYQLYFVPQNGHDILKDLIFPADATVKFLDPNTVQIRLDSKNSDSFKLSSGNRKVFIRVNGY